MTHPAILEGDEMAGFQVVARCPYCPEPAKRKTCGKVECRQAHRLELGRKHRKAKAIPVTPVVALEAEIEPPMEIRTWASARVTRESNVDAIWFRLTGKKLPELKEIGA